MPDAQSSCSVRAEVREIVDREISHLQKLIERTISEKEVALSLQRNEYHRRLEELNNAHDRAEKAAAKTVSREAYDLFVANHDLWRDEIHKKMSAYEGASVANARFFGVIVAIIGLVFSAVTIWLSIKSK